MKAQEPEEATPTWVAVALEEYRTLRQKSLQAIDRQHQILALGMGASGVLLGLGANQPAGSAEATVLLAIVVPMLVRGLRSGGRWTFRFCASTAPLVQVIRRLSQPARPLGLPLGAR